jgi:hypothetical protein
MARVFPFKPLKLRGADYSFPPSDGVESAGFVLDGNCFWGIEVMI